MELNTLEPLECASIILVVADSNFINLCQEPHEYVKRLKSKVAEIHNNAVLHTVSGKYGISHIDESVPVVEINDRNKTLFSQTLENASMLFDELMIISISINEPFIESAKEVVTSSGKTFTHYRYQRK